MIDGGIIGSRPREIMSATHPFETQDLCTLRVRPQNESYPISPRQTESYPSITEAYSRQTPVLTQPDRIISQQDRSAPLQDPNLTSHLHPSTWPSTTRTLTRSIQGGTTPATGLQIEIVAVRFKDIRVKDAIPNIRSHRTSRLDNQ
ncbi:uncharacterized protein [Drosophila pseudoobscura]|uniref:Uncharacterized protein n=1 Tax=Drosophila pseudoobscura pseudoobscura TaxID=46245 RepID=A0A6I8VZS9_DROPS|nr:uncharacterized protein LOC117184172 [Drosophila pseudoobscura]